MCVSGGGQAAAHGLPMVATKNGGPVDIHKVFFLSFFLSFFATLVYGTNRS